MTFSTVGHKRIYFEDYFAHSMTFLWMFCIYRLIQILDNVTLEELFVVYRIVI